MDWTTGTQYVPLPAHRSKGGDMHLGLILVTIARITGPTALLYAQVPASSPLESCFTESTFGVVYADLEKVPPEGWQRFRLLRAALQSFGAGACIPDPAAQRAMARAGVRELYVVLDFLDLDFKQMAAPVLVRAGEAQTLAIRRLFGSAYAAHRRGEWLLLAGPGALRRLQANTPVPRPELIESLRASQGQPLQIALAFPPYSARVFGELLPRLPGEAGEIQSRALIEGCRWVNISAGSEPEPHVLITVQGQSCASATALRAAWRRAVYALVAIRYREDKAAGEQIARLLVPDQSGSRLTLKLRWGGLRYGALYDLVVPLLLKFRRERLGDLPGRLPQHRRRASIRQEAR